MAIFRTEDPDALADALHPVVGRISVLPSQRRGFGAELSVGALPRVGLFNLGIAKGRLVVPGGRPFVGVTFAVNGGFEVCDRRRPAAFRAGTAHILSPAPVYDFRSIGDCDTRVLAVAMGTSLLRPHLRAVGVNSDEALRLRPQFPAATRAGFMRYLRFLWCELQLEDSLLQVRRVAREAEETLAAMLAEAIGMAQPEPTSNGKGDHAVALRRAEEFLDAHLEQPVSLAEVATAAGAGRKTLSRAFHERHGLGPIGFLRRRRLEAARRDLAAAEPGCGTVTQVALRYGFAHLGRFAGTYRDAFGELPSETLDR